MQFIPVTQIPNQAFDVVLDGQYCTISIYWRQDHLYLDLSVNGNSLAVGRICQNGTNILQSNLKEFRGSLHFFDIYGKNIPVWDKLNTRYILIYAFEGEELPDELVY